jgi:GNAT superfamily N-acetyltransferase
MKKILFKDADRQADFEFGRLVHHVAYRDVVTRQFGSWEENIQDGFFKEGWNLAPHKIILVDGVPAGVYSIAVHQDHIFFSELQILPGYQGHGIGTKIMKEQMQYAKSLGLPLRLQVLRENKAQELYLRLGFIITDTTDTHLKMAWK